MTALERWIEERLAGRAVALVGVGNRLRGDDGVGSWLAERLGARCRAPVFDAETVPEDVLGPLLALAPEVVVLVDAADHGGRPGETCVAPARELAGRCGSTHGMLLLLLARALESRGVEAWLVGIQPARTDAGAPVSAAVAAGARAAEDALARLLGAPENAHA